jgi:hypothetical protein
MLRTATVVIELKAGPAGPRAVAQILAYRRRVFKFPSPCTGHVGDLPHSLNLPRTVSRIPLAINQRQNTMAEQVTSTITIAAAT